MSDEEDDERRDERQMPVIEIRKGGGPDIADGVYTVMLVEVNEPKTVTATQGPNAGKVIQLIDWEFVVLDGEYADVPIQGTTSVASGPKSKLFSWVTALQGGKPPEFGSFDLSSLIGRQALATVRREESGWVRLDNLGAMPTAMRTRPISPVVPGTPADTGDALPF